MGTPIEACEGLAVHPANEDGAPLDLDGGKAFLWELISWKDWNEIGHWG